MGTTYHNKPIVTDGLVFCMDPANKVSYPGSGTAITDIVGGYNGITVNNPTFSTDDGGAFTNTGAKYLQFDTGLYDLVKVGDGITVSMWCKIPDENSRDFIPFNFRPCNLASLFKLLLVIRVTLSSIPNLSTLVFKSKIIKIEKILLLKDNDS